MSSKKSTIGKPYHKNPRYITEDDFSTLSDSLDRLGDLSGIVHNLETDEIIGGNQRSMVFDGGEVQIIEEYEQPDEQGTVAHGFVVWKGHRFAYRQVRWDEETAEEANVRANVGAGKWDWNVMADLWEPDKVKGYGLNESFLEMLKRDTGAMIEMLGIEPLEDIEFKEYDEDIADEVEMITCPHCGQEFPK